MHVIFRVEGEGEVAAAGGRRKLALKMDDQCLVLSGEWVCGDGGKWDFIIEKHRMGRMVLVYEGIGYVDLERNVLREFVVDEARFGVALSYWPPTSLELATGIRTPPVLITNDGTVKYFCKHLKRVEEQLMSGKRLRGGSSCGVEDSGLSSGANSEGDVVLDEIELRPRGYDQEFWDPLLAGDYGGSNAVNVVFNEDEIVEGLKKNSGPRTYVEEIDGAVLG
ncbi:hypothetical protein F2Q68_00027640 [Brassica cretica]|uniref:Uncharacterized protein n=1 Tax=Brassica cretica TaxID=69181 RepID=A0A8S9IDD1_BRACR|nr:hypothetical protein F2Q68_00027640 [Brassica cretica]